MFTLETSESQRKLGDPREGGREREEVSEGGASSPQQQRANTWNGHACVVRWQILLGFSTLVLRCVLLSKVRTRACNT